MMSTSVAAAALRLWRACSRQPARLGLGQAHHLRGLAHAEFLQRGEQEQLALDVGQLACPAACLGPAGQRGDAGVEGEAAAHVGQAGAQGACNHRVAGGLAAGERAGIAAGVGKCLHQFAVGKGCHRGCSWIGTRKALKAMRWK
jgi:hypothetical protein